MGRATGRIVFVIALVVLCTQPAQGQQGIAEKEFREQHDLHLGFETPHTKWGKPYAGGTTRVLFFCGAYQYEPRTLIVETMQRFDIDARSVYAATRYAAGFFKNEPMVLGGPMGVARMMQQLDRPFDCYVIVPGFRRDLLPEEARYKILKRVSEGAGLIVIGKEPFELLHDTFKIRKADAWLPDLPEVTTYAIGKGRGIRFTRVNEDNFVDVVGANVGFDLTRERLGRAILWAAGKQPEVNIALEAPAAIDHADVDDARITFSWEAHGRDGGVVAKVWIRSPDGRRIAIADNVALTKAGGSISLTLPKAGMPGGAFRIEAQAHRDGQVESWTTRNLQIRSDVNVKITVDKGGRINSNSSRERGEAITGRIHLSGLDDLAGTVLRVEMIDVHDRIIHRQHIPVTSNELPFEIPTSKVTPSLVRLDAELTRDGRPLQRAELAKRGVFHGNYVMLTTRNHDRFNFLVWGKTYNQTLRPYLAQMLADAGITAQLTRFADWESAAAGLSWVPYATSIRQHLTDTGVPEHGSWNDEEAANKKVQEVIDGTGGARELGTLIYSLGDENDTFLADRSEHDLAAYRQYLAGVYPDIDTLNASWETQFASFDEVTLSDPDDLMESTALQAKNTPRWWDRRAFMRYNYAMVCDRYQKAFDKFDPGARAGFEGAGWMDDNIDLLVRHVRFWGPYSHITMQVIGSITPPDFLAGQWGSGWHLALHGSRMFGWWRIDNAGAVHGSLTAPDMSIRPMHRAKFDNLKIWLDGLGTAMMHWKRQDDGVVMLHSFASANATQTEAGPSYGRMGPHTGEKSSHAAWTRNLRACGLQFRYITDGMLERGEWDGRDDKLLILSRIEALSTKQVQAILRFAEHGGTVIADVRPGLYDDHLKAQTTGLLDGMFGVRHTANVAAQSHANSIAGIDLEVNPAVELAGGSARDSAGRTPLIIENQIGRGNAVLLNFTMRSYPALNHSSPPGESLSLFEELLSHAGIEPQVKLSDEDDRRHGHIEIMRWRSADREIVALHRPKTETDSAKQKDAVICRLSKPVTVTDLRTGLSIDNTDVYQTALGSDEAAVIVLTRARPEAPQLTVPATVARGTALNIRAGIDDSSMRVLRVRAYGPDGNEVRAFRRNDQVRGEDLVLNVPIAYNEVVGPWRLTVTDATTGRKASADFTVE